VFSPVIFFADFIQILAFVLTAAILVRIVLSWFSIGGAAPFVRLLFEITEPILAPIRRVIPTAGMFDFSCSLDHSPASLLDRWIGPGG